MKRSVLAAISILFAGAAHAACPPPGGAPVVEAIPAPLPDPNWAARLAAVDSIVAGSDLSKVRLLFLGDSLTEAWAPPVYNHFYGYRSPLNLGVRGSGTQSLLYIMNRLPLGTRLRPEAVVLLIGTNNLWPGVPIGNVVGGIETVLAELRQKLPQARIVLIDLLPRGESPNDPARAQVAEVNQAIAACADSHVIVTDVGSPLLDGRGVYAKDISFDGLHLTWIGYAIMGTELEPAIKRALGEN
jgi:lysophospholipase L1-like esterase